MKLQMNKKKIQNCPTFNEIPRNRKIQVPLLTFLTQKKKKLLQQTQKKKINKKLNSSFHCAINPPLFWSSCLSLP